MRTTSIIILQLFICIAISSFAGELKKAEYFFNQDPGYGNGFPLSIEASQSEVELVTTLSIGTLPTGFNTLYVRACDVNGKWGQTSKRPFYIFSNKYIYSIAKIEYYYTTTSGYASNTYQSTTFEDVYGIISFSPDVSELKIDSTYTLHIWAIDSLNRRGFEASADFTYTEKNTSLEFSNVSNHLIYPNPASAYINMELDSKLVQNTSTIRIINIQGKVCLEVATDKFSSSSQLAIHSLPSGTYTVLFIGETTYYARFIKE